MYAHFLKPVKCSININSLKYSEDEIVKYSLCQTSNHDKLFKDKILYKCCKTTNEFIDEMKNIYKEKRRKCNYCNNEFQKYKDLETHLYNCIHIKNTNEIPNENSGENSGENSNEKSVLLIAYKISVGEGSEPGAGWSSMLGHLICGSRVHLISTSKNITDLVLPDEFHSELTKVGTVLVFHCAP
jgi:hypothetical protein